MIELLNGITRKKETVLLMVICIVSTVAICMLQAAGASPVEDQKTETAENAESRSLEMAENLETLLEKKLKDHPQPEPKPVSQTAQSKNDPGIGLDEKHIPSRDQDADSTMIDLSDYYNAGLEGSWHTNVSISPSSLKEMDNDLSELPKGIQTFSGVSFDIRGIIQLQGQTMRNEGGQYPDRVDGIKIGKKFDQFHVLHATGWQESHNTVIGAFVLHYTDGERKELTIVYGKHVLDWWRYSSEIFIADRSSIVWYGSNPQAKSIVQSQRNSSLSKLQSLVYSVVGMDPDSSSGNKANAANQPIRLFQTTWENPRPYEEVESVDYVSKITNSAPFLIAITVE